MERLGQEEIERREIPSGGVNVMESINRNTAAKIASGEMSSSGVMGRPSRAKPRPERNVFSDVLSLAQEPGQSDIIATKMKAMKPLTLTRIIQLLEAFGKELKMNMKRGELIDFLAAEVAHNKTLQDAFENNFEQLRGDKPGAETLKLVDGIRTEIKSMGETDEEIPGIESPIPVIMGAAPEKNVEIIKDVMADEPKTKVEIIHPPSSEIIPIAPIPFPMVPFDGRGPNGSVSESSGVGFPSRERNPMAERAVIPVSFPAIEMQPETRMIPSVEEDDSSRFEGGGIQRHSDTEQSTESGDVEPIPRLGAGVLETLEAGVQTKATENESNLDISEMDPAVKAELESMDDNNDGTVDQTELAMAMTGGSDPNAVFQRNQIYINPILMRLQNDPRFIQRQIKKRPIDIESSKKRSNQVNTLQQAMAGFDADINLYNVRY